MGFVAIATTGAQSTTDLNVTTPAIDCTGANLIILAVAAAFSATATITDSHGNTYVQQANYEGNFGAITILTCFNPTVSASMTFSYTTLTNTGFPAIAVLAVSGAASGTIDQQTGQASDPFTGISVSIGPITPSQNNALWVGALNLGNTSGTPSNTQGTLVYAVANAPVAYGLGMSYGIQTTATSQVSGWMWSSASVHQDVIGSFLPSNATTGSGQGRSLAAGYAAATFTPPPAHGASVFGGGGGFAQGPNTAQGFGGGSDQSS